nr:uncharacterized protein LOC100180232 [Ciona intestinalis]|eukprot:XP_002120349.1 uncharacterized protein LOC100180232 [Ciona intestinalis]
MIKLQRFLISTMQNMRIKDCVQPSCHVMQIRMKSSRKRGRMRGGHKPMPVPPERLEWSQFDALDKKQPRVELKGMPLLEESEKSGKSTDARVLKVLSLEFGNQKDLEKAKVLEYGKHLQRHPNDFDSPEMQVAQLTVHIRTVQEHYARIFRQDKKLPGAVKKMVERRNDLLDFLHLYRFETYTKVLKLFKIKHKLPPLETRIRSELIDKVTDMRIRAFAESRRVKFEEEERKRQLSELKQHLKEQRTVDK